jgi:2-polyprenyl-6-methoxyphenol hydroxylase-like FAD-dependent oxidoreductase
MSSRIAVLGGGIAGLSSALLLARRGFAVTLFERDQAPPPALDGIGDWARPGAAQVRQLHTFLGLFRRNLRDHLPDVHRDLLAHGVEEISAETPEGTPEDPELVVLASRRPVVEWALYRALAAEPLAELRYGTSVRRPEVERGRLRGVHVRGGLVEADLLIDAGGRRSPLVDDFTVVEREVDCGVVYNTRFYRLRDGVTRPPLARGVTTMVAGIGFGAGLFYHDNRTFAIGIGRLPDDNALKSLREPGGFDQAVRIFGEFTPWLDQADVLTDVVPMAGLRNTLRTLSEDAPAGYFPIGDALCTTDPAFGRGASIALEQAVCLAEDFERAGDGLAGRAAELTTRAREWVRPWFEDSVRADLGRTRLWEAAVAGETISPSPGMPVPDPFLLIEAGQRDPVLWQAAQRQVNLLAAQDSLNTPDVRERFAAVWRSGWRPAAAPAPSHGELVAALEA